MGRIVSATAAPAPFATVEDYIARHGDIPTQDVARIEALLLEVSSTIRGYTGQRITRATTTQRIPIVRCKATLSDRPVHDVLSVTNPWNDSEVPYTRLTDNVLEFELRDLLDRGTPIVQVDVEYDHGFDDDYDPRGVLPALVGMTTDLAARAYGVKPQDSGVTQESIAGYSYQIGGAAAAGARGLLPADELALDRLLGTRRKATTFEIR